MKKCKCKDWKKNIGIVNSALVLYSGHGFGEIKKSFIYCPYCGHNLEEQEKNK